MKLTVAALMFLVLLEFAYCAPHAQQYAPQGGQPMYTNTGAMYPFNPSYGQNHYPNGGAQWPQQNWENRQPNYMNQNEDRSQVSKKAGANVGYGLNFLKGVLDLHGRGSLGDEYSSTNEHRSNTNVFQPERTFGDPFGY